MDLRKIDKDFSKFEYQKGDELRLFGIKVEVVNMIDVSVTHQIDYEDVLYEVYNKDMDYYSTVPESVIKKHGEVI